MKRVADIYETSTLNKYQLDVCWKTTRGKWTVKNTGRGKYYKCELRDESGNCLASVKYNFLKSILLPTIDIVINGEKLVQVKKSFTLGYQFSVLGGDYKIENNGLREQWLLYQAEKKIAEIHVKEYETDKSCYQLITDDANAVLGTCICTAIDIAIQILARVFISR